jgi:hypothetical protein
LTRAMAFATPRLRDVDLDRGARSVGRSVDARARAEFDGRGAIARSRRRARDTPRRDTADGRARTRHAVNARSNARTRRTHARTREHTTAKHGCGFNG